VVGFLVSGLHKAKSTVKGHVKGEDQRAKIKGRRSKAKIKGEDQGLKVKTGRVGLGPG
jgi:hypothetical protein